MHPYVPSCLSPKSMFFKTFPRKRVLICLRNELGKYFLQFQETLKKHLTTEFEVELQDGSITASGREVLTDLQNDHEILQYDVRIDEMCIQSLEKIEVQCTTPNPRIVELCQRRHCCCIPQGDA